MGDVIRRDKAIPVQARRADVVGDGGAPSAGPTVVVVPGAAPPAAAPPPPPGVTNNVIYVVAPPATPATPPPPQVHHHHHTTQVIVQPPRRRRRLSTGTSFLGTLGFVVGGLACGMDYLPPVARFAGPIALAGLAMAALAWVGAVVLRRVGTGMPFLGMIVSVVGYGLWLFNTGQAQATYDRLRKQSPVPLPAVHIPVPHTAAAAVPTPAVVPPARPPAPVEPATRHAPTFFGL